jgi:uncharacterized protein DUF1656
MGTPNLAIFHTVELFGFYLPPLVLWAAAALVPFAVIRWLIGQLGLYRFIWHRSLFNLSLYVLLVGSGVFFGTFA